MSDWIRRWARHILRDEIAKNLRLARREGHSAGFYQGLQSKIAHGLTLTIYEFNDLRAQSKIESLALVQCTIYGDENWKR